MTDKQQYQINAQICTAALLVELIVTSSGVERAVFIIVLALLTIANAAFGWISR